MPPSSSDPWAARHPVASLDLQLLHLDALDLAEVPRPDVLLQLLQRGFVVVVLGDYQGRSGIPGRGLLHAEELIRFVAERFLDENRGGPGGEGGDRFDLVPLRRRRDDHPVGPFEKLLVDRAHLAAELPRELVRPRPGAAVEQQFHPAAQVARVLPADGAAAGKADPHHAAPLATASATRRALAAMVRLGLTPPEAGKQLPSTT